MAQQVVSLATQSMSLPPRYEYLLEIEQSGGARCHLAIDPGNGPGNPPVGVEAEAIGEAGAASAVRPAQAREAGVAAGDRTPSARRLVAVHLTPPAVAEDDELRAQFAARAAAFLPLRHPNLVSIFEAVAERRRCYWVSEFVPGEPLSRLLKKTKRGRRALSTRQILAILGDVAHALEHAHCAVDAAGLPRPVVHRNVCPSSVLVSYDGVVKVSGEIGCGSPELSVGPFEGPRARLACVAPECCSDGRGDTRSDVYALGAILWEALAGRPRSLGLPPEEALVLRLRGGEPDLENVCPDVLPALAAVTRRALSTDPGDRHQSVGALREELENIARLDVLKYEPSLLFGFMCNHFWEEHAALQDLFEQHSMSHTLFGKRPMSQTGTHARPQTGARAMSKTGAHSMSQTDGGATLQSPLEERAGGFDSASGAREAERHLRDSGLRRLPEASVHPPTTAPPRSSRVTLNLPVAKLQRPKVALPLARVFGRTEISVVVLMMIGALTALEFSSARNGTRAAGPFDRAQPATVFPSVGPQPSESVHAEPASAATAARSPSALASVVSVEPAKAAAAAIPGQPVPERGTWKRLRPVRGNSPSRATRRDSPIEPAARMVTRTLAMRDVATLSEQEEESPDGAGVDLRMLKERPPRAIDKQDPYLP